MNSAWLLKSCAPCARLSIAQRQLSCQSRTAELPARLRYFSAAASGGQLQETTQHHGSAPRVAIIGSGPAGFYTARKLMREVHGTKIDMYERLPVPFGLVRFGVAPDHPEVKNCQDEFEQVASSRDYNFIGNVQLGQHLPLPILAKHYDAIVFSYGASKDRELGLQGEDKPHIFSARAFVGWYNGLPEYRDLDPDLKAGETAIVVGQGNVAMDVARVLLSNIEVLRKTDLTSYAIEALKTSRIRRVHVVGRRGPMQAAFTIKEVRELIQLPGVNFEPISPELFPKDIKALERPKRRLMELLQKGKPRDPNATKSWSLDFLLAPSSLDYSTEDTNKLTGVTFTRTQLEDCTSPSSKVSNTTEQYTIPTSTLFRSIGYRAEAIPGMDLIGAQFDERTGTLCHDGLGRIIPLDKPAHKTALSNSTTDTPQRPQALADARMKPRLYCAGWVKRGPTGVIASTMTDAFQTAEAIVSDWKHAQSLSPSTSNSTSTEPKQKQGWEGVRAEAESGGYRLDKVVSWDGWHSIDNREKRAGQAKGKPREKYGTVREMVEAAGL